MFPRPCILAASKRIYSTMPLTISSAERAVRQRGYPHVTYWRDTPYLSPFEQQQFCRIVPESRYFA
jgi:hypothetical protein